MVIDMMCGKKYKLKKRFIVTKYGYIYVVAVMQRICRKIKGHKKKLCFDVIRNAYGKIVNVNKFNWR